MLIKETDLRRIVRRIIKEENSIPVISDREQEIVDDIISAVLQAKNQPVHENTLKDVANAAVDIGFRLLSFKATIPMIATGIIMYCQHKGIQPEALTIQHAQSVVNFLGLEGHKVLEIIINVLAGLGGGYGVVKGIKAVGLDWD